MSKRVFVNGYGSIGSRITAFLMDDPEIKVVGAGKYSADDKINTATSKGIDIYVPEDRIDKFNDYKIAGTISDALDKSDLVVDASPNGLGYKNKVSLYEPKGISAVYQGGESATGDQAVSDMIFNSRMNYDKAFKKTHVMQGSCNVTGMGRVIGPLQERYNNELLRFDLTLVRRWADIEQTEKDVVDTIQMTEKPHHGDDAKMYLKKDTPLYVRAIKVPSRQMHLHIIDIRFKNSPAPKPSDIHDLFADEFGVAVLWTAKGTKDVRDYAQNMGFNFTDTNMLHIHANMTVSIGDTVQMMYSDDQTGIVIPENHMLLQAMLFDRPYKDAFEHTESVFHMAEKKTKLEKHFAKSNI